VKSLALWSGILRPPLPKMRLRASWSVACLCGILLLGVSLALDSSSAIEQNTALDTTDYSFLEVQTALRNTKRHFRHRFRRATHRHRPRFAATDGGSSGTTGSGDSSDSSGTSNQPAVIAGPADPPKVMYVQPSKQGPWPFSVDGKIPWVPLIIVGCVVFLVVALCIIGQKWVRMIIGWIETGCFWLYLAIIFPFKMLYKCAQIMTYPVKEVILKLYERCHNYYYPYLMVT